MADQLCTTAQVKTRLGITDAGVDALISEYIDQVSDWISEYTGRKLVPDAGATYTFDTLRGSIIEIPRGIRAVTSLGLSAVDQPDSGGTYTTVAAADIALRPLTQDRPTGWPAFRVVVLGGAWRVSTARNGAKIVGDFGFAAAPPEVQGVALDAVVAAFKSRKMGTSGVIGGDDQAVVEWGAYFGWGSPQRQTLMRLRGGRGIA